MYQVSSLISFCTYALATGFFSLFSDRCKLKDREKIQILQEKFLDCLNFQLMKSRKDYNRYVYKIFDILLRIRDLTELNFKVNQKFLQEWGFAIHEFPLWKEMLSYENDV
jgi:hypothetical protein